MTKHREPSGGEPPVERAPVERAPDDEWMRPDVELLAIEERFVAEQRAGTQPRLADYIERYPHYAAALVEFASSYLLDTGDSAAIADDEPARTRTLSAGTRRALRAIFAGDRAGMPGKPSTEREPGMDETLAVAETPGTYATNARASDRECVTGEDSDDDDDDDQTDGR